MLAIVAVLLGISISGKRRSGDVIHRSCWESGSGYETMPVPCAQIGNGWYGLVPHLLDFNGACVNYDAMRLFIRQVYKIVNHTDPA